MIFATMPLAEAEGAILAHSVRLGSGRLDKGRVLTRADLTALAAAGIEAVVAARIEPHEIHEDEAATQLGNALAGPGIGAAAAFTGRVNLHAEADGIVIFPPVMIDAVNGCDEAITVATLRPFERVRARQIVATIKIIPFAAPHAALDRALDAIRGASPLALAPFAPKQAGLISTVLPGMKTSLLTKSRSAIAARLDSMGARLAAETHCAHAVPVLTAALSMMAKDGVDPILIFGASAIVDRQDVIPAALTQAGGTVLHLGMPVDPGNLLMLGRMGTADVIGLPGCARSPKLNGFDWVLERLIADLPVGPREIMGLGVGGLLKDIPSRPQPRAAARGARTANSVAAIVLAAGRSQRMGAENKLLADLGGEALVRRAVRAACTSNAEPVIVVTGHQGDSVAAALTDLPVRIVHNPDFASGLASSLRAGLAALPDAVSGAAVLLGDMPDIDATLLNRLIAAFDPDEGRAIIVPVVDGRRGNPVLWGRRFFEAMAAVAGDTGARHLIGENAEFVREVPVTGEAVLLDVDTPEALETLRRRSTS